MPLWAVQGKRFERQREIWDRVSIDYSLGLSENQAESFLEAESQSLQHRYRPGYAESLTFDSPDNETRNLRLISERCQEFEGLKFHSSALQEEQERELAPEIELEQEVHRPPVMTPREHHLHIDISVFVHTGRLKQPSSAYEPAFRSLSKTSVALSTDLWDLPTGLLVTADFAQTVSTPRRTRKSGEMNQVSNLDAFERPVRWILTSSTPSSSVSARTVTRMIIISPYEARCLLPAIRQSKTVTLHQYAPRQSFAFDSLDELCLHNIPEGAGAIEIPDALRMELNLFAGQLYFGSYSEYRRLCAFLGLVSVAAPDGLPVDADGFIRRGSQESSSPFRRSPVSFLRVLMSQVRKDGRDIDKSHIGQILNGILLSPSDDPT